MVIRPAGIDFPQHVPRQDGTVEPVGHFRVPAHHGDAKRLAGLCNLGEDGFDQRHRGRPFRQQQSGEKPLRLTTASGNIVSIDHHGVVTNGIGGKGDRVRLGDQIAVAHVDDRRVFSHGWSDDDTRIRPGVGGEQALQQLWREFAWFENGHKRILPALRTAGSYRWTAVAAVTDTPSALDASARMSAVAPALVHPVKVTVRAISRPLVICDIHEIICEGYHERSSTARHAHGSCRSCSPADGLVYSPCQANVDSTNDSLARR